MIRRLVLVVAVLNSLAGIALAGKARQPVPERMPLPGATVPQRWLPVDGNGWSIVKPAAEPVGQIEVKQYPAYRKASTSGLAEFWTLFQHIKQNNVTMTAPVEMDYGDPHAAKSKERSMSFLYERPDQGSTGKQGSVEVIDVPAMTVVSIGCRGERTTAAIADARDRLVKWLDEKKGDYVSAGPMRIMGYNSPFVPRDKNFFEVQIPVKPAAAAAPIAAAKD